MVAAPLFDIRDLVVEFPSPSGYLTVVDHVSVRVGRNELVCVVGESGSGKSVTMQAAVGLVQAKGGRVRSGSVTFDGRELVGMKAAGLNRIRGNEIGFIFQEPMSSLNPAYTVGEQIAEVVRRHRGASRRDAWARAVAMLDRVGIATAAARAHDYPHQFSGGMRQRVMMAIALACDPKLLIADEPTTALDVTIQARMLALIQELRRDLQMSVLFITHDLGVVAEIADRVVVMYAAQAVETTRRRICSAPRGTPIRRACWRRCRRWRWRAAARVAIPGAVAQSHACRRAAASTRAAALPCRRL